jgi:hypothetical protein
MDSESTASSQTEGPPPLLRNAATHQRPLADLTPHGDVQGVTVPTPAQMAMAAELISVRPDARQSVAERVVTACVSLIAVAVTLALVFAVFCGCVWLWHRTSW